MLDTRISRRAALLGTGAIAAWFSSPARALLQAAGEARTPAFERWISPTDGTVEFKGQHVDVRVLDRDAVQIRKNGKTVTEDDTDVTIE